MPGEIICRSLTWCGPKLDGNTNNVIKLTMQIRRHYVNNLTHRAVLSKAFKLKLKFRRPPKLRRVTACNTNIPLWTVVAVVFAGNLENRANNFKPTIYYHYFFIITNLVYAMFVQIFNRFSFISHTSYRTTAVFGGHKIPLLLYWKVPLVH